VGTVTIGAAAVGLPDNGWVGAPDTLAAVFDIAASCFSARTAGRPFFRVATFGDQSDSESLLSLLLPLLLSESLALSTLALLTLFLEAPKLEVEGAGTSRQPPAALPSRAVEPMPSLPRPLVPAKTSTLQETSTQGCKASALQAQVASILLLEVGVGAAGCVGSGVVTAG
jgi:hypothetical protein